MESRREPEGETWWKYWFCFWHLKTAKYLEHSGDTCERGCTSGLQMLWTWQNAFSVAERARRRLVKNRAVWSRGFDLPFVLHDLRPPLPGTQFSHVQNGKWFFRWCLLLKVNLIMKWAIWHVNQAFQRKGIVSISSILWSDSSLLPTNLCHYHPGGHFVLMHGGELRIYLIPWALAIKPSSSLFF